MEGDIAGAAERRNSSPSSELGRSSKAGYRRDSGGTQAGHRRDTGGTQAGHGRDSGRRQRIAWATLRVGISRSIRDSAVHPWVVEVYHRCVGVVAHRVSAESRHRQLTNDFRDTALTGESSQTTSH